MTWETSSTLSPFPKVAKDEFCCESSSGLLRCEEGRETLRVFHRVLCNNFRLLLRFLRRRLGLKKGEEPGRDEEIGFSTPPHSSHWSLQQSSHYNTSENSQVVKIASFLNRKTHRGPICLLSPCRLRAFEQINFWILTPKNIDSHSLQSPKYSIWTIGVFRTQ